MEESSEEADAGDDISRPDLIRLAVQMKGHSNDDLRKKANISQALKQQMDQAPCFQSRPIPLNTAIDALEKRNEPSTSTDYTNLKDVLIVIFMASSLRRPMEFAEFRLGEFLEMKEDEAGSYIISIMHHKTAEQGE